MTQIKAVVTARCGTMGRRICLTNWASALLVVDGDRTENNRTSPSRISTNFEKVVANRLHEHIYKHHSSNDLQSAYKRFHITETDLLI